MTPRSPGNLRPGEKLTLEIRYKNPQKEAVHVFATPLANGRISPSSSSGSQPLEQGSGVTSRWFYFANPATVDQIRITMVDAVTKNVIATIMEPVQLVWGDGHPAPAPAAPGRPAVNPLPATPPAQPAALQPGMLKAEFLGYEVAQKTAAALFNLPPDELESDKILSRITPLATRGEARLVKMPFLAVPPTGGRGKSAPEGSYSLEANLAKGRGDYVELIYILKTTAGATSANGCLLRFGRPVFVATMPAENPDNMVLVFTRVIQL